MNFKKLNEELQKYVVNEISDELVQNVARARYIDKELANTGNGTSKYNKNAEEKFNKFQKLNAQRKDRLEQKMRDIAIGDWFFDFKNNGFVLNNAPLEHYSWPNNSLFLSKNGNTYVLEVRSKNGTLIELVARGTKEQTQKEVLEFLKQENCEQFLPNEEMFDVL